MPKEAAELRCIAEARSALAGRTIVDVRYLSAKEAEDMMWNARPLVLILDDGTMLFPASDDEGNEGGALHGQDKSGKPLCFPVL